MANLVAGYIVLGGGLTGCVIASRFSQSNKKPEVILLNWGSWLRADAVDYDEWAEVVGDKRWSYEGFKPWFRKTECFYNSGADADEYGFDRPMNVTLISAFELNTHFVNKNGSISGLTEMYENSCEGMRQPSNTVYLLTDVKVFMDTIVYKVTFSSITVTRVELADGRKVTTRKEPERQKRNLYEVITLYVPPGIPGFQIDGTHIATSTMLLLPTSRGTVSIRSKTPNDPPHIQPNLFSTQLDRTNLVKTIVESESPSFGEGLNGLTPLTADANDEVVDVEGRVLGVKGLRVADVNIVPMPLGGYPQATLYPMTEQLASIIINRA
ncbi:choline dehydrogenase [Hypoxylon crocopeplum]|nr:choline dehydrogenase [Hypoxylon crocopeplum]